MNHDDFNSLEIEQVMGKVLAYCQSATGAHSVHWLSAHGLERVHESSSETWHWSLSTADVIGKHVMSSPQTDLWDLFHVWRKVADLYPKAWTGAMTARSVAAAPSQYYSLPIVWNGTLQGILLLEGMAKTTPGALTKQLAPSLTVAAKYVAFAYQQMTAKNMSYLDEVTGLYNQRYLPMVLQHEIYRSKRDHAQFSLLFLDIDYFKMVNDGRGHWVGSKLLIELANLLKLQVRSCDYAFRYGGDEFIVLLSSSNSENSKKVAERIRTAVETNVFKVEGQTLNLTVSIGLASYPEHAQSAEGLIQLADQAMYYGKRKSRNIVFVAS